MEQLVPSLLFLHIMGAIIAFGPTFAFPILGAAAGREPLHANFMTRAIFLVSEKLVIPLALFQGLTGLALVWFAEWDLLGTRWLLSSLILYVGVVAFALGVNTPNVRRVIELSSTPPGPGGPPPELLSRVAAMRRNGMLLALAVVVIVALMVLKPTI